MPLATRQSATTPTVVRQFRQPLEAQLRASCSYQPPPLARVTHLMVGTTEPLLQRQQSSAPLKLGTHQVQILTYLLVGPPIPTPLPSRATIQPAAAFQTSRSLPMPQPRLLLMPSLEPVTASLVGTPQLMAQEPITPTSNQLP